MIAETTTAAETAASATICRNAPLMLISRERSEQKRRPGFNRYPDCCHPKDRCRRDGFRGGNTPDRFANERADANQQGNSIRQSSEDRCTAKAVGVSLGRSTAPNNKCTPCDQKAEYVRKIVRRIGQQRQ